MEKKYCVIAKTGQAEMRAMTNLSREVLDKILPIVELTRGRKTTSKETKEVTYPYFKLIEKVKEIYHGCDIAFDVTSIEALSSPEIDELYSSEGGYSEWIRLLDNLRVESYFRSIIPSVLLNYDDENLEDNVKSEIQQLNVRFDSIMYRYSIGNEDGIEDLKLISNCFPDEKELLVVVDCEYVPTSSIGSTIEVCKNTIQNIKSTLGQRNYKVVLVSTTYPNNVAETNDEKADDIPLREIDLYDGVCKEHNDVIYGDYGTVNPQRNDGIIMANGWLPKIDVALPTLVYYNRRRRPKGTTAYSSTYELVARLATADSRFPLSLIDIWGIRKIVDCSMGSVPSSQPSFWISVRMNTHVCQQVIRLGL